MPHLEHSYYFNLIVWCFITIAPLHFFIIRKLCTKVSSVITKRQNIINNIVSKNKKLGEHIKAIEEKMLKVSTLQEKKVLRIKKQIENERYQETKIKKRLNLKEVEKKVELLKRELDSFEKNISQVVSKDNNKIQSYLKSYLTR